MELKSFQNYTKLTTICRSISENPYDLKLLEQLKENIHEAPKSFIKAAYKPLLASFYPFMKTVSNNRNSFSCQGKQTLVETLRELLDKLVIENSTVFFNFYSFLLFELYDYTKHQVIPVTEEYKTALLDCMISLIKSVSLNTVEELYVKENVPKFSQIIYVCGELAKNEKSRDIRCTAIMCIMALAKVMDSDDFTDIVLRDKCAGMFIFFLPGLSSTFTEIVLEDLKIGHKVPMMSIKAFGRIIALVMQDYNPHDQKLDLQKILAQNQPSSVKKTKWKDKKDIDKYLETITRNAHCYRLNDEKLNICLKQFATLTHHSHINVRLELVDMICNIMGSCVTTMPQSICTLIEILIILSQDEEFNISNRSNELINDVSSRLSSDNSQLVFESLEEGFYNAVNSLPRKFNSIDDAEKISALNLLIGYIKLFGKHKLNGVLLSPTILHKLVQSLLHISELEQANVSLLEEYSLKDLNLEPDFRSPWVNFHYFKDEAVKNKIETLCIELAKNNCCEIIYDSLFDTFLYDPDHRKEAVYVINAHILGLSMEDPDHFAFMKNILDVYTDQSHDLQATLISEEYTLEEIQNNVIIICLLTEGIGKLSLVLKDKFRRFLLKSLYMVLERAGSGHSLIRAAGLLALNNLTYSCGYSDITDLINSNFDFFSYHVERKLNKVEDKEGVLNVLSVVLKYSNKNVLLPMSNIVNEVLLQSCDRFKQKYATAYLKTFEMFIHSLRRWFDISVIIEPMKSRMQKEMEHEDFKVTGIDYNEDFSDDIMKGKTAEDLYREDMEKENTNDGVDENEEYKKPEPPVHIKLTSSILRRSLHFLPSKGQEKKILVLNILENGIEILRDWEDELLPVVHQVWSPLVQRFREETDPLTLRLSIRLLKSLCRLSKDFIRMRVTKEVLPNIKETLKKLAPLSYLKDKGSSYRYSQNYKLQLEILSSLGPILYYIDADEKIIANLMDMVFLYLSDKQPQELQAAAVKFYNEMATYDLKMIEENFARLKRTEGNEEYEKNIEKVKHVQICYFKN